jgi:hypothetical protein
LHTCTTNCNADAHSKELDKIENENKSFFSPMDNAALQLLRYEKTSRVNFTNILGAKFRQKSLKWFKASGKWL